MILLFHYILDILKSVFFINQNKINKMIIIPLVDNKSKEVIYLRLS